MLPISFWDVIERWQERREERRSGIIGKGGSEIQIANTAALSPISFWDFIEECLEKREQRRFGFVEKYGLIPRSTYEINGVPPRIGGKPIEAPFFKLLDNQGHKHEFLNDPDGYLTAWKFLIKLALERSEELIPPLSAVPEEDRDKLKERVQKVVDRATSPKRTLQIRKLKRQLSSTYELNKGSAQSLAQTPAATPPRSPSPARLSICEGRSSTVVAEASTTMTRISSRKPSSGLETWPSVHDSGISVRSESVQETPASYVGKGKGRAVEVQSEI